MPEEEKLDWYVVHTYSGYEDKVKDSLDKTVKNRNLEDKIDQTVVPVETITRIKNGKPHTVKRKLFPGYVLVHMVMSNDLWYIVRNTRGCTGFVGPQSKPVPLSEEEALAMVNAGGEKTLNLDFEVGSKVALLSGSFENFTGTIVEIDEENQKLKVSVPLFGRDTIVEVDYEGARKVASDDDEYDFLLSLPTKTESRKRLAPA